MWKSTRKRSAAFNQQIERKKSGFNSLKRAVNLKSTSRLNVRHKTRAGYTDMPTIPDIDAPETGGGYGETGFDVETDIGESESSVYDDEDEGENRY